jgi:DNA polymerase III delta subunit
MQDIITIVGTKENMVEDVRVFLEKIVDNPEILFASKKDIRNAVIEQASSLFVGQGFVLVLIDPEKELLEGLNDQLQALRERIHIILYLTAPPVDNQGLIGGTVVIMEKEKEKRVKDRVLALLKKYDKVMTDKGFKLFREKIKDESVLESELMKLINFVGEKREIKLADVASVVTETHEDNLLNFFDTVAQADKKEMLNVFENLLLNGLNILAIQGFLVKQTRLMLQAKDMEEIFKAGHEYPAFSKTFSKWKEDIELTPIEKKLYLPYQKAYYAFKLSQTSRKLKRKNLLFFFDMLLSFDAKLKSGTKHDRIYLEQGLLET